MRKNTKKFISFSIAMIMTLSSLSVVPVVTNAAEISADSSVGYNENGFTYYIDFYDSTARIVDYNGTSTDLVIPSTLGGSKVVCIGSSAFKNNTNLTSVTIPDTVTTIENRAFSGCSNIKKLTLGKNVSEIGMHAFQRNIGLTTLTIPDSVTFIDTGAFGGCSKLREISIGKSVSRMGGAVFASSPQLRKVTIAEGTTVIGPDAFTGCYLLDSIKIPNTVTEIGSNAFYGCTGLKSVTLGNSVKTIGYYAFSKDKNITSLNIPDSVELIEKAAFKDCTNLATLSIGGGVNKMEKNVFQNCTSLNKVTIGRGTTVIGDYAFDNCGVLKSVSIPDTLKKIGYYAFKNCSSLTSVVIPDSVNSIASLAFADCSSLTTATIGNSVSNMGGEVFSGCSSLAKVKIGDGTFSISTGMFKNCKSLTDIEIPESVVQIGEVRVNDDDLRDNNSEYGAFWNCTNNLTIHGKSGSFANQYAKANNFEFSTAPVSLEITPTSVALNKTTLTLDIGRTSNLRATVYPSNAANKKCTWRSSNTSVATVDSNGKVTAKQVGTATITVKTANGKTASCNVTVQAVPTSVSLNKTSLTLDVSKSYTLTKTVSPSNAVTSYTWSSSNTRVATVDGNGKVTAKKAGTATITVKTANGKTASCNVTVQAVQAVPTSVSLNKTSLTLDVSKSYTLAKTVSPSNAVTSYTWSSSNTSVATVDGNGKVTAKKAGTATITVKTSNGKTATCKVTVNLPAPQITGLANTTGGIKISWNKVDGAYGYRLYYKPASGGWKRFKDTTATSFTDSGVVPNKTETYTIRCIDKNGNTISGFNSTGWSKKYTPAAPTVSKLDITKGGIKLSWNKIAGVYGYRLYYKTSSGGWKRFKDTTATSFTDSGVSPNRTETYTIRCIDKNGKTVSGFNSKGWSKKYTPVAPTITRLSNTSKGVSVTWNKIAGVYGYRLYRKYDGGSWTKVKDTTSTSFTDSGAKKGKKVTYTVRCIDRKGKTVSGFNSKGWSITRK